MKNLRKPERRKRMSEPYFKFTKVRDVKSPTRGTPGSAGIDFYIPDLFSPIYLHPQHDVLIPSGIKIKIPENYFLLLLNKSGVATKMHLDIGAGVVDSDYSGEIHLHLTNTSDTLIELKPGMKILQGVLLPAFYPVPEEISEEDLIKSHQDSVRQLGGFGSTNHI